MLYLIFICVSQIPQGQLHIAQVPQGEEVQITQDSEVSVQVRPWKRGCKIEKKNKQSPWVTSLDLLNSLH